MIASFLWVVLAASPPVVDLGVGVGVGVLDHGFGLRVIPDLVWRAGDDSLHLAAPLTAVLVDGEGLRLRASDWDELGEYSALIENLTVRRKGWLLRGGRINLNAAHGTVVDNYRAGSHPDHRASGLALRVSSARTLADFGVDRVTDPRLFVAELRHRLFASNRNSSWMPDVGISLAYDSVAAGGTSSDGRLVVGVASPWRLSKEARAGVHFDGVVGIGVVSLARTRWHARAFAERRFGRFKGELSGELRGSADGLAPEPFDAHYALYRYDEAYARPDYGPGLGWRFAATLAQGSADWLYLSVRQDPGATGEAITGVDASFSMRHKERWSSHWSAGYRPGQAGWFALGEGRYVVMPGVTTWLAARRLRRAIEGTPTAAVDVMFGVTVATRISSAK
jgi:hypothetical protein